MKKSKKIIFLFGHLFLIILVACCLFFLAPKSYEYHFSNSTDIAFIHVFPKSVLKIIINPSCEQEVQKGTPSPGFGASYVFCDKRWWSKMLIESTSASGDERTFILKYAKPGEKGDSYRETFVQTEENIIYNTQTYTRTSPFSILRFITHR